MLLFAFTKISQKYCSSKLLVTDARKNLMKKGGYQEHRQD
jgi:hypothetical protein